MKARIETLANIMKAKQERGAKFVLMLGAGASLRSGVKRTGEIMAELLDRFGKDIPPEDLEDRFAKLWSRSSEDDRRTFVEPYLDHKPSRGYEQLARLVEAGYFDLILTFNFDNLLEQAFNDIGFTDFKAIIRGETIVDKMARLVEAETPRVKILKLHGSLRSSDYFLFSPEEMLNYPAKIESLVEKITAEDIIVCGYAFNDHCVMRAFSREGGSVYCVNPRGAPTNLKVFLTLRKSGDNVFWDEFGEFDRFFQELSDELLKAAPAASKSSGPNPFKFLESYEEDDKEWFIGRRDLSKRFVNLLEDKKPKAIHVVGKPKVGKTSFVRAGVLANLDSQSYSKIYVRCHADIERCLAAELERRTGRKPEQTDLETTLRALADAEPKRVILVLDQFERVARRFPDTSTGRQDFISLLRRFRVDDCDNLTTVLVAVDESSYLIPLMGLIGEGWVEHVDVARFEARDVEKIVRFLAQQVGLSFDDQVIEAIAKRYEETQNADRPFTLAHVQAICHILGNSESLGMDTYESVMRKDLEALDQVINEHDILSFVEDFPLPEERTLITNLIKIVSRRSKGRIAHFIKEHYGELFVRSAFPKNTRR